MPEIPIVMNNTPIHILYFSIFRIYRNLPKNPILQLSPVFWLFTVGIYSFLFLRV